MSSYLKEVAYCIKKKTDVTCYLGDPKTFSETMSSRNKAFWKDAINDETNSILCNNTWVLIDLLSTSKPIACKWVFRRKYNTDRIIQTFNVIMVARGFSQKKWIDYFW